MSSQNPIKKADLARHWKVSRAYLTRLAKPLSAGGKDLPEFTSLAEADAWRTVNAPPRPGNALRRTGMFGAEQSPPKNETEAGEKTARNHATTTPAVATPTHAAVTHAATELWDAQIDLEQYVTPGADFDRLMPEKAERVAQIAYGLFERAAQTGQPALVSAATKNFHEAARAASDVRARFIEIQERTRVLLPLDEVMDILGTELQAVRAALAKHGERVAAAANPSDPGLAQRVVDADIDQIFASLDLIAMRTRRELTVPAA